MSAEKKKIAVFGGSFNPPALHHKKIAEVLAKQFDIVKVIPCGPRPDKETTNEIKAIHRAVMTDLAFGHIADNIEIELFDLENSTFTTNYEFEQKYKKEGEVWHVVGSDLVKGGAKSESEIQKHWHHGKVLWRNANFAVVLRDDYKIDKKDLPPHCIKIDTGISGTSTEIRNKNFNHHSLYGLVVPQVQEYIGRHNLYRGTREAQVSKIGLESIRPLIIADPRNLKALHIKKQLGTLEVERNHNLIVVIGGDGTMLHAIKENWRRRLPFFGINAGHIGFLLNDVSKQINESLFLQEFIVRHSSMLVVDVLYNGGTAKRFLAFNDAFVHAEPGRTGWFKVMVNNKTRLKKLVADGVLTATPAGSTAYARAMGANPVPLGTDLLVVVGSNVLEPIQWNKGANLVANSEVRFINADKSGVRKIYGFVDGVAIGGIKEMKIHISRIASADVLFTQKHDLQVKLDRLQFPV